MTRLAIDLFCGLGGWTEGLLAEGYYVVGFDIKRHEYGEHRYPAQLVLQDMLTLHGRQFKDAALIVASPPCQEFSYMAMPWTRAKQIAAGVKGEGDFPKSYTGSRTKAELTALFNACFRIQCEASEAAGHKIPLIVENVRGAQKWVGRAKWHYGSYYLWGDVPALMPIAGRLAGVKAGDRCKDKESGKWTTGWNVANARAYKNNGGSWFAVAHNTTSGHGRNPDGRKGQQFGWERNCPMRSNSSQSNSRKAASAMIANIPFALAQHIARVFKNGRPHD